MPGKHSEPPFQLFPAPHIHHLFNALTRIPQKALDSPNQTTSRANSQNSTETQPSGHCTKKTVHCCRPRAFSRAGQNFRYITTYPHIPYLRFAASRFKPTALDTPLTRFLAEHYYYRVLVSISFPAHHFHFETGNPEADRE